MQQEETSFKVKFRRFLEFVWMFDSTAHPLYVPLPTSVLDLDAFERCNKAEGLGVVEGAAAQVKNLHDAEHTCKLFRFLQLLCEGHNLGESTYLPLLQRLNQRALVLIHADKLGVVLVPYTLFKVNLSVKRNKSR